MKVQSLGHVVLTVSDLARSEAFYGGVLGFPVVARGDFEGGRMIFFSFGDHHDFAIMQPKRPAKGETRPAAPGLNHVAFKIGDDVEALRQAKAELEAENISVDPRDHGISQSLYFADPDGNWIELYVDISDDWRRDPQQVANSRPLKL